MFSALPPVIRPQTPVTLPSLLLLGLVVIVMTVAGIGAAIMTAISPQTTAQLMIAFIVLEVVALVLRRIQGTTIQQQVIEALRQSESQLRVAIDNVDAILYTTDERGNFLFCDGRGLQRIGIRPQDIEGDNIFRRYPQFTDFLGDVRRTLNGKPVESVREIDTFTFENHLVPDVDDNGAVTGLIGFSINVTDYAEVQRRLAEERNLLRTILGTVPDAICLVGHDGTPAPIQADDTDADANPTYPPPPHLREIVAACHLSEQTQTTEYTDPHTHRHYEARIVRLNSEQAVMIVRDVTVEHQRTENLRQFADELARSNAELEQFAYVASHDLQEPLRKIQAFGEQLQRQAGPTLDSTAADYLDRMRNATDRMQTLIKDLLALSGVTTHAQSLETVDINAKLQDVLDDLELRIIQSKARIHIADLPTLEADPVQIRQLFLNLLSNALKYARDDVPPEISLTGEIIGAGTPQAHARLTLRDNGIGFDPAYAERIFGVFQRLHGRNTYEGTGIGLAICRKIVERHRGSITAEGCPGEGAVFTIILPLAPPAVTPPPA